METNFEKVWNRVKAYESIDDTGEIKRFIRDELRDAAEYAWLAEKTRALRIRKMLAQFAADERRHARKLQAAAYVIFGENSIPAEPKKTGDERILRALRRRYGIELESAEAYRKAATTTPNALLKKLYPELSKEERMHAEALCGLFEQMM